MQLTEDRRALHRIPELCWELPETMAYLKKALAGLNCRVFSPVPGSLCAWFDFGASSAIAFRADCDALPITERSGADYASTHPGKMHACGHDGHMAILLELARRLARKQTLRHNVLLVFQPGEESPGGAEKLCETGIFEKYGVEAIFGLHIWPGLPEGRVFSRENELMSRSGEVNVDIFGRSAHIAKAAEGIDTVAAGVEFYRRAMELEASLPEGIFRLLKFGRFTGGTVRNALAAHTRLEGSLRAFQDTVFEQLRDGLYAIGRETDAAFGSRTEIRIGNGYPAVLNPPELYRRVQQCVPFSRLDNPSMTAEDFSFYQKRLPGLFFFLGAGDVPALHTDNFDFNEEILLRGADLFEALAERFR